MGHKYRRMDYEKPWPGLACNLDFAKAKGLEHKVNKTSKIV